MTSSSNEARMSSRRQGAIALVGTCVSLLAMLALGHDGRRTAQLAALAFPVLIWLMWPVGSPRVHRARAVIIWLWAMAFSLDAATRAYLLDVYQAAPDSSFVQFAAANTNSRESAEYLAAHWRGMLAWFGAVVVMGILLWKFATQGSRRGAHWPRWAIALIALLSLVAGLAYVSKPWRRLHPIVFWTSWHASVQTLRSTWADLNNERETVLERARRVAPTMAKDGLATMVLVITDSVNRDNMALYGYKRPTTPRLLAHKAQLKDQMLVMKNAWSVDASTLPSLRNILGFGTPGQAQSQHVLALARAAGYKVWWISNHDDVAIEQEHGRLADVVEIANRVPGRAGASLDGGLIVSVRGALADPADRKLIVVHLMGAHPHYKLRFPSGENSFDDRPDDVEEGLERNGRSVWVRKLRQEYDSALLYQDFVVAETFDLTRRSGRADGYRAWMYLSDHGQEVGHNSNHAGHSPGTASGYRIPTIIWRNLPSTFPADMGNRPFRADWASWTIADLLNLRWEGSERYRNALSSDYRWAAPTLPMPVDSFVD